LRELQYAAGWRVLPRVRAASARAPVGPAHRGRDGPWRAPLRHEELADSAAVVRTARVTDTPLHRGATRTLCIAARAVLVQRIANVLRLFTTRQLERRAPGRAGSPGGASSSRAGRRRGPQARRAAAR